MFEFMRELLSDKNNGKFVFEAFSLCHILYLIIIAGAITAFVLLYKNKSQEAKQKLINVTISIVFGLYMLDFFAMPFSEGKINIDKLPFHICTLMGVMCFASRHSKFLSKYKTTFSLLGMFGGIMYLVYPAGVSAADGYSYRIIQTVLYHGLMIAQGVFMIFFKELELDLKNVKYDIAIIMLVALWAMIGNTLYSGTIQEACNCVENCPHMVTTYDHDFNWFFVKHDALYIISDEIDGYIAPFMTTGAFSLLAFLVRLVYVKIVKSFNKQKTVCS